MAHFNDLPAELQIEIFERLSVRDIKSVRATCKKCRDNATPALYRNVVASARYRAMVAFQNISMHPVYCNYVKEIIFDGSTYEKYLAKNAVSYRVLQNKDERLALQSFHWARRRWARYQAFYEEQEDMKASGVLLQTLTRALESMPKINSVVYSPSPRLLPVEYEDTKDLLSSGHMQIPASSDHPFCQLVAAIFQSNYTGVRNLTVERAPDNGPCTELALSIFDLPGQGEFSAAVHLFQNLTSIVLNITLKDNVSHRADCQARQLRNLRKLLASAVSLRHLNFHITIPMPLLPHSHSTVSIDGNTPFSVLGLAAHWRELRSLSLEGVHAEQEQVEGFIELTKHGLSALAFTRCTLYSGRWRKIVDEVVKNTSIKTFRLRQVGELDRPESLLGHDDFGYDGQLVESEDRERRFVNTSTNKESVYEERPYF